MTTIYKNYYYNINTKIIDLYNINFSVYILKDDYKPNENDELKHLTPVYIFKSLFTGDDMWKLHMNDIIERIENEIKKENEITENYSFVVFDNNTNELCFGDELTKVIWQDIG